MRNRCGRLAMTCRVAVGTFVALGLSSPAAAQFGIRKKLRAAAGSEAAAEVQPAAAAQPGGSNGTVVLTADVVDRLLTGLKAGEAERQAAAKERTPYGRYQQAQAAYATAKSKCEQAQQTFPQRIAADQKLMDKYNALVDKMVQAQSKGNMKLAAVYSDSAMAMQDPSCAVKQPEQPSEYYQAQRDVDARAEKAAVNASGFSQADYAQARERVETILRGGTPPGDVSASEQSAVSARAGELKRLLGIQEVPAARAKKPRPATPAPAAAPAQTAAQAAPAGSEATTACLTQNLQKHRAELEALGKRAQAAQQAGNTAALMAIADTIQQLQMAGCGGHE